MVFVLIGIHFHWFIYLCSWLHYIWPKIVLSSVMSANWIQNLYCLSTYSNSYFILLLNQAVFQGWAELWSQKHKLTKNDNCLVEEQKYLKCFVLYWWGNRCGWRHEWMTRHCLKASWCSVMRMALEESFLFNRCTNLVEKKLEFSTAVGLPLFLSLRWSVSRTVLMERLFMTLPGVTKGSVSGSMLG